MNIFFKLKWNNTFSSQFDSNELEMEHFFTEISIKMQQNQKVLSVFRLNLLEIATGPFHYNLNINWLEVFFVLVFFFLIKKKIKEKGKIYKIKNQL